MSEEQEEFDLLAWLEKQLSPLISQDTDEPKDECDDEDGDSDVFQLNQSQVDVLKKAHIRIKHTKLTLFDMRQSDSSVLQKLVKDSEETSSHIKRDDTTFMMAEAPLIPNPNETSCHRWIKPDDEYFKRIIEKSLSLAMDKTKECNSSECKTEVKKPSTKRRGRPVFTPIVRKNSTIPKADAHCVSIINSRGQAGFIDIAPSLLDFHPVNIVTFPLNENLHSKPMLSLNTKRELIECQMTHQQFLQSSFTSLVSLKECIKTSTESTCGDESNNTTTVKYNHDECVPFFCVVGATPTVQTSIKLNDIFDKSLDKFAQKCYNKCIHSLEAIDTIREEIKRHGVIARNIPIQWILLQYELELCRHDISNDPDSLQIVTFDYCKELGKMYGMEENDIKEALVYFHKMSIFLYFEDILSSVVFLQPQPVIDNISQLMMTCVRKTAKNGVCKRVLLKDLQYGDQFEQKDFESLLVRNFVIAMLPDSNEFFFPGILSFATPDKLPKFGTIEPLVISLPKEEFFPVSLFLALVFKLLLRKTSPKFDINKSDETTQYRNAICLTCELGGSVALVNSGVYLEVYYSGSTKHCFAIRNVIHDEILKVVDENGWRSSLREVKDCFFCSIATHSKRDHLCTLDKNFTSITCCKNERDSSEHLKDLGRKKEWLTDKITERSSKPDIGKVHRLLCTNPGGIQGKWKELALVLKVQPSQLNVQTSDSYEFKLYNVLEKWRDTAAQGQFTWNILIEAVRQEWISPQKASEIEELHVFL